MRSKFSEFVGTLFGLGTVAVLVLLVLTIFGVTDLAWYWILAPLWAPYGFLLLLGVTFVVVGFTFERFAKAMIWLFDR